MPRKVRTKVGFEGKVEELEVTVDDRDLDPWGADAKLAVVGTRVPRVDGPLKVTGRAKYTSDIAPKNVAHARIVRSPLGAGTVKAVDGSAAEKVPGFLALHVLKNPGTPVLFHGDEIAAVAAETEEAAAEAVRAVVVEIDAAPCVTTIEDAEKPGAPRVFANRENVQKGGGGRRQQDADAVIARADRVVEATYSTEVQTHSALEPHGLVVAIDGDAVTAWISTQAVSGSRGQVANAARVKESDVRVVAEHVGGGFGAKFGIGREGQLAVALARKTGRPVKLMLDRQGEHLNGGNRPSSIQAFKGGLTKDGRLSGIKASTRGSGGVGSGAGVRYPGYYETGAFQMEETTVLTNAGESRAFRAPGHPQGFFGFECFLDELAAAAGTDPLEFRRAHTRSVIHLAEMEKGAALFDWKSKWKKVAGSDPGPRKRGAGMATSVWFQAGGPGFKVDCAVFPDGTVEVRSAAQDIGTGTRTVLAVIAAEELGLKPEQVTVRIGDTNFPPGPGSGGSTTAPTVGPACRLAAYRAKQTLLEPAAKLLGAKVEELDLKGGVVVRRGAATGTTFRKLCEALAPGGILVSGERVANYAGFRDQVAGVQFAEVEVDVETGQVRVLKVVALQDAGRVVDRLTFESQVSGGVIQGVSYALFEQRRLDPRLGVMTNADFLNYKIAGPKDCPEIVAVAFDVANAKNNVGMMGLGEPPTIPTAAAVANAVANAIGARVRSLPITPEKVLAALEAGGKK